MILNADLLDSLLPANVRGRFQSFAVVPETGSTNADLSELPGDGLQFLAAERQTAGRGRRNKAWNTPRGESLAFSIGATLRGTPQDIALLPLAVGAACGVALRQMEYAVALKWPNDIVRQHASGELEKVGGILVELKQRPGGAWRAVCGVGLNVTPASLEALSVDQPAACLEGVGPAHPREAILAALIVQLEGVLSRGVSAFPALVDVARAFDALRDHLVQVLEPQSTWTGTARGWNDQGLLVVQDESGIEHALRSAEVSIRRGGVLA